MFQEAGTFTAAIPMTFDKYQVNHLMKHRIAHLDRYKSDLQTKQHLHTITDPLHNLEIVSNAIPAESCFYNILWSFRLAPGLALSVLIERLRVFSVLFDRCAHHVTFKDDKGLSNNVFCGIFSNISCYPSGLYVDMHLFTHSINLRLLFDASIKFNLLSSGEIISRATFAASESITTFFGTSQLLLINKLRVNTSLRFHHIIVDKHQQINIFFKRYPGIQFIVFEGPGKLSTQLDLKGKNKMSTQSFQLVLHVKTPLHLSTETMFWSSVKVSHKTSGGILRANQHLSFSSNNASCGNICVERISFSTVGGSFINVSFLDFRYEGDNGTDCVYGGLAFHEYLKNIRKFYHIVTLCTSLPHEWKNFQSVHSSSNQLLITAYSYSNYSKIKLNLTVAHTFCKTTRVNWCVLYACLRSRLYDDRYCPYPFFNGIYLHHSWRFCAKQVFEGSKRKCAVLQVSQHPNYKFQFPFTGESCQGRLTLYLLPKPQFSFHQSAFLSHRYFQHFGSAVTSFQDLSDRPSKFEFYSTTSSTVEVDLELHSLGSWVDFVYNETSGDAGKMLQQSPKQPWLCAHSVNEANALPHLDPHLHHFNQSNE